MSKSIPLHISHDLEQLITIVLANTDDFESEASLIRIATKKYLKERYADLLLEKLENE